jgi:hypothetical protein
MIGQSAKPIDSSNVVFLVGAGRSGTTLLYKLLCLHPRVAYISNFENRSTASPPGLACRLVAPRIDAKLAMWFRQGGNAYFVNRPWFNRAFPTPNEGEAIYRRCGLPLSPPRDYVPSLATARRLRQGFERIRRGARAQVFLSKRTANNRRIRQLDAIFPAARYVHIVRDGREVTQSLAAVEWWDDHTVWWDGRKAREIEQAGEDRLTICARNWVHEVNELDSQLVRIPAERRVDLRFEQLLRDPLAEVERVVHFLGLEWTTPYRAAIESLQLHPLESPSHRQWTAEQLEAVLRETRPTLSSLGYAA